MRGQNFCPICGKTTGRFIKAMCMECFQKKHSLAEIPDKIEFEQCVSCGKAKFSGKLALPNNELLASLVEKKVKVKDLENAALNVSIKESEEDLIANVLVKGIIDSVPLSFEKQVPLIPLKMQCDPCMRLKSQYHEAIIQLRGKDRKRLKQALDELLNHLESLHAKDSLAAAIEVNENKNGFDLKIGSKKAAQSTAKHLQKLFDAETKRSSKLLGRDKTGNEKHRFTFLVRI